MAYCGDASIVKREGETLHGRKLKCRSWSCPDCQPDRQRRLIAEAMGGEPNTFITLTLRADFPGDSVTKAKALTRAWRLVRLRWLRHSKRKKLAFLTVMEATVRGTPHLHILARAPYLPQPLLSAWMAEIVASPIVHIKRIDQKGRAASYVAKYAGKAPHQFGSCKRYYKSRDYELRARWREKPARPAGVSYDRHDVPLATLIKNWRFWGYEVQIVSVDRATARPPPGGLFAGLLPKGEAVRW